MDMRSFFFALAPLLVVVVVACSGSNGDSVTTQSSASPAADLSGEWSGSATALGQTVSVRAEIIQNGRAISGTMRSPGGCIGGGKLDGSVAGDTLRGTVTSGDVIVIMSLTVSGDDQLDGTFDLPPSGVCPAQQGSLSLIRE
jgi:hypothetical protein